MFVVNDCFHLLAKHLGYAGYAQAYAAIAFSDSAMYIMLMRRLPWRQHHRHSMHLETLQEHLTHYLRSMGCRTAEIPC